MAADVFFEAILAMLFLACVPLIGLVVVGTVSLIVDMVKDWRR